MRESGRQFDPKLVEQFVPLVRRVYGQYADVDAYILRARRSRRRCGTMRRSLVERLSKPAPGEAEARPPTIDRVQ